MDQNNADLIGISNARIKLLFDANVINYAVNADRAIGIDFLDYMDRLKGNVDWFISNRVAVDLFNSGVTPGIFRNLLNCDYPDMKMDYFPYEKLDGGVGFVKLNKLSGDDWSQVCLAYNHEQLIIVTNDRTMHKTAHAVTNGRAITFMQLLNQLNPYWANEKEWQMLQSWFKAKLAPLKNNSSWILPPDAKTNV